MDQSDEIIRSYSRLTSLKENLSADKSIFVEEKYILDYHEILNKLSQIAGSNLNEFQIPNCELKPTQVGGHYDDETGEIDVQYSQERYCGKTYFFSKLDALLSYFSMKYFSEEKRKIGFDVKNMS